VSIVRSPYRGGEASSARRGPGVPSGLRAEGAAPTSALSSADASAQEIAG
jgi:hypothetical protein